MTTIKLTLRNIFKNRLSFLIGFTSLIIGFTVSLFIGIYLYNEISYDKFHEKDNIYRVSFSGGFAEMKTDYAFAWAPLGPALKNYFPEITDFVRLYRLQPNTVVKYEETKFLHDGLFYADQNFFDFFSFELISGNPKTVLSKPNSVVITTKISELYFGDQNPIGKIIKASNREFIVTGVVKSPPINSHIKFNFLFSMISMSEDRIGSGPALESWRRVNFYTYFRSLNKESIESIKSNKQAFIDKELFIFKKDWKADIDLIFFPITDIHLKSHLDRELEPNSSTSNLWILFIIALFVFVISCVNFILITTNINITRFKEVYVKKVMGQSKFLLILSYLFEIFIICLLSFLIALLLFYFLLPQYNQMTNSEFTLNYLINWKIIIGIISALLIVGIVPGYFSGKILFNLGIKSSLQTKASFQSSNSSLILIIQFCIAFTLIICSLVFSKQLKYIQNHDLGYDKSNILLVDVNWERNSAKIINEKFNTLSNIKSTCISMSHLAEEPATFIISLIKEGEKTELQTNYNYVNYNFKTTYGLEIIEGRFFSMEFPTDSFGVVVNQSFCKEMGLSNPIGENLTFLNKKYKIIGVSKDFFFCSFRERIEPYIMLLNKRNRDNRLISIKFTDKIKSSDIKELKRMWNNEFSENFFIQNSLEDKLQNRYQNDMILVKLLRYLSFIVIIIALSGLLGQNFLMLRVRRKEIAIRKVLGANFKNLLYILNKKYIILLLLSWIGACIISYFLTNDWLNNFIFTFENKYLYFIIPIIFSILMSFLIISLRTLTYIKENPANTLQNE
ncbi:MAG: FtsX-like permease family protein [Bacteroidales bacterium]|nr:FtsX-like permease family protein [Bacteroidales bacterium]